LNPFDFARKYFGHYQQKGDEIKPMYCPFCNGGEHHDKYTFALNAKNMTYNCKRGTCGKQGHFTQLCKEFGEQADRDNTYEIHTRQRIYKKPQTKIATPQQKVEAYLKLRGFSSDTWKRRNVGEYGGNIAMPYYENGELVMVKFRKPEKYNGKGQKAWREEGGKAVLWGMDLCDCVNPLVIVEGEMDALALDECGIKNVVSVPSGAEDLTWIELCWDWLERFKQIIIWGDNDEPGQAMVRNLITRLGDWRCYVVDSQYKDANECLVKEGAAETAGYVLGAKPVPIHGLIDLASVTPYDVAKVQRVASKIRGLDEETGGFLMGELSIWTGRSGQGKSTILGQQMIEAIDAGESVCAYSGELRADRFQYWINLQAAGRKHIAKYFDKVKGKDVAYVPKETAEQIKEWYQGRFWLYDNNVSGNNEETGILRLFSYAARKYGCKVFLVDNLMTSRFDCGKSDSDYYRAQSNFVGELIHFAKAYNVHVHLVAHPRKTQGKIEKENVSGSGDITNRADNVFSIDRMTDEEKMKAGFDTKLTILKNRSEGVQNVEIGLMFDQESKRFYQRSDTVGAYKMYGWETLPSPWDEEGEKNESIPLAGVV
jgi:twinkle protein